MEKQKKACRVEVHSADDSTSNTIDRLRTCFFIFLRFYSNW